MRWCLSAYIQLPNFKQKSITYWTSFFLPGPAPRCHRDCHWLAFSMTYYITHDGRGLQITSHVNAFSSNSPFLKRIHGACGLINGVGLRYDLLFSLKNFGSMRNWSYKARMPVEKKVHVRDPSALNLKVWLTIYSFLYSTCWPPFEAGHVDDEDNHAVDLSSNLWLPELNCVARKWKRSRNGHSCLLQGDRHSSLGHIPYD